jgi:DNA-binding CsgD family transcriptional regulator
MFKINKKLENYSQVWNDSIVNFSKSTSLERLTIEKLIGDLFTVGDYYFYVIDFSSFPSLLLSYVDESAVLFFGIDKEKLTFDHVVQNIHPDDIGFCLACEQIVMKFITKQVNPEELLHYKFSYSFRIKNQLGKYRIRQHQAIAIALTSDGKLAHVINVHTDIGHITRTPNKVVSIIGLNGRPSYLSIDPLQDTLETKEENLLSKRELEVIKHISNSIKTNDIAEIMHISINTVNTHRRNMMKKLNAKNAIDMIQKAKELLLF